MHNFLSGPCTSGEKYDAIYSLDVLEHIAQEKEHLFLNNLYANLKSDGVLIIGMPSKESQNYSKPASETGHINCKTGTDLKKLLEKSFTNVFLFSMNDEVVHTGYTKMAHYLFAVCTPMRSV